MSQDLSHLIERIRTEAVERAEGEARRLEDEARAKAAAIVAAAEAEAERTRARAQAEAEESLARGRRALEQAGRDLLIHLRQGIERLLDAFVADQMARAYTPELLQRVILALAEHLKTLDEAPELDVVVSPDDREALIAFFLEHHRDHLMHGWTLRADGEILRGFRVAKKGANLFVDFTDEALAEALSRYLRPYLAERLKAAAAATESQP